MAWQISHALKGNRHLTRSGKLTQQWKMDPLKMHFLLNMGELHCYVTEYWRVLVTRKAVLESGNVDRGPSKYMHHHAHPMILRHRSSLIFKLSRVVKPYSRLDDFHVVFRFFWCKIVSRFHAKEFSAAHQRREDGKRLQEVNRFDGSGAVLKCWKFGLPPTQDSSHHQDYYIFSRESQPKPSFATVTGWGVDPSWK